MKMTWSYQCTIGNERQGFQLAPKFDFASDSFSILYFALFADYTINDINFFF